MPSRTPEQQECREAGVQSVLRHLDTNTLASSVRRESRARQWHLPPVSVYRWWARRTESVTGAIIDAISSDSEGNDRLLIADPFAGGGVIALAALLRGHRIYAQDINPWAAHGLASMIDLPTASELSRAANRLRGEVEDLLSSAYGTSMADGTSGTLGTTLRVATGTCPQCGVTLRLFPFALVSMTRRVDRDGNGGYLACPAGHVNLYASNGRLKCPTCDLDVDSEDRYTKGRRTGCLDCGWRGKLSEVAGDTGLSWEIVLVERVSPGGRTRKRTREIGPPTPSELMIASETSWRPTQELPAIDAGVEAAPLTAHGFRFWHDLFPNRQRVVLEGLLRSCAEAADGDHRVLRALEMAIVGATEMAGYVSRWDPRYLKAYEAVANHRFSFTTLAAEPNVWGAHGAGRGTLERRLAHMAKASSWLEERIGRPLSVEGPQCSNGGRSAVSHMTDARVVLGGSQRMTATRAQFDAVVTDPPYHDDVQYAELSDIFRAWTGQTTGLLPGDVIARRNSDATNTGTYQDLLTEVLVETRRTLRRNGHLVLSYANRHPSAWIALFSALQASGFRSAGYAVVQSENESDFAKSGRRACNLDILLDLVQHDLSVEQYQPQHSARSEEDVFCHWIGRFALHIGQLGNDWEADFRAGMRRLAFVSK